MAHPCIHCGSECYCNGDIDDVIVSKTPKKCEGCGCDDFEDDDMYDMWLEDDEEFEDKTQYTDDGGLIVSNDPTIIHYP